MEREGDWRIEILKKQDIQLRTSPDETGKNS